MHDTSISIAKVEGPQEAEKARVLFEGRYPGLSLSMHSPGRGLWIVKANGPFGSFIMNAPSPLRGQTLTALCRMACMKNTGESHV